MLAVKATAHHYYFTRVSHFLRVAGYRVREVGFRAVRNELRSRFRTAARDRRFVRAVIEFSYVVRRFHRLGRARNNRYFVKPAEREQFFRYRRPYSRFSVNGGHADNIGFCPRRHRDRKRVVDIVAYVRVNK